MLKPIKTKKDHEDSLARAYELMQKDIKQGSKLSDELEILSVLIEEYENKHYPIPPPHPCHMADVHTKETRSKNMAAIKGKNTKLEMLVRKFLHANISLIINRFYSIIFFCRYLPVLELHVKYL